jgi:glycosyltransferase involved in cell wall biosynthesis
MSIPVICTIIAKNYLAQARCLVESFLAHHPNGRAFVLLVDRPDGYYDPDQEPFTTIQAEDIGIPEFGVMTFRYTVLELSTAVKPFFLEYLFQNYEYDRICYFDPDIYFYQPIDEIWEKLQSYGIVLTPHLLGPLDDDFKPNELDILRAGTYNLGFIGLSRHPEAAEFLRWWKGKMVTQCIVAFDRGLFVDQRWVDLVPGLFSSVNIHRDPGCNVAYWNLYHRHVEYSDGEHTVNGSPLKFYHFSGFYPDRPDVVSKHQNRYTFRDIPIVKALFDGYQERLYANGYETVRHWPYAYDSQNIVGVRIPDAARALWREFESNDPSWCPFDTTSDVQFLTNLLTWLNEPMGGTPSHQPLVTRLALAVYQQRPDIQRAFPDVLGRDRLEYVRWFVNWGKDDLDVDDFFVRPLAESLERILGSGTLATRRGLVAGLYQTATSWLFRIGVGRRIERLFGARLVDRVRSVFIGPDLSGPVVPSRLPPLGTLPAEEGRLGLNVVGYLSDETGVGENARATLRALHGQDFPVAWTMVKSYAARQNDESVLHLPQGHPYNTNLFCVNADQTNVVYDELGVGFFAGKYNIGYWHWELQRFPEAWLDRFQHLDEIWVGSHFVQNTLAHVSPIPVITMGVGVHEPPDSDVTREMLRLPEDKFIFLFVFDMLSFIERKNPFGLIEAYRRAFGPGFHDTSLVIKVTKLDQFPEHRGPLERAVASVSGNLMDGYLGRSELDGLFNVCDAYVSLHRSEGFGLTIAEAMSLGKPVIATAYSGNADFMNVTNSYPVEYRLVELEQDHGPYRKGNWWADPDLDHAAAQMRRVFENRDEAVRRGMRAAADMKRWYGSEAMARRMIERLNVISCWGQAG